MEALNRHRTWVFLSRWRLKRVLPRGRHLWRASGLVEWSQLLTVRKFRAFLLRLNDLLENPLIIRLVVLLFFYSLWSINVFLCVN